MVAISFSVFKEKILNGEKTQTIRPYSKKRYEMIKRIGKLQLYWKQRTKECEFLKEVELEDIFIIRFDLAYNRYDFNSDGNKTFHICKWDEEKGMWDLVVGEERYQIIQRDGFLNIYAFENWFYNTYGEKIFDMKFMVIRWR